jgi:hypothetical protein
MKLPSLDRHFCRILRISSFRAGLWGTVIVFFLASAAADAATVDFSNYCSDNTGATDCSSNFATAETAANGGTILVHSGTYRLNNVVLHGSTTLRGDSRRSTILRGDLSAATVLKLGVAATGQGWTGKISDLSVVRANGTLPGGTIGISAENVSYGTLENVELSLHDIAIKTNNSWSATTLGLNMDRVFIHDCVVHAWLKNIAEVHMLDCEFGMNGGEQVVAASNLMIIDGSTNDVRLKRTQFIPRNAPNTTVGIKWINIPDTNPGYYTFEDINLENLDTGFQSEASCHRVAELVVANSRLTGEAGKLFDFNAATDLINPNFTANSLGRFATTSTIKNLRWATFMGNFVSIPLIFDGGSGASPGDNLTLSGNTFTAAPTFMGVWGSLILSSNALVYNGATDVGIDTSGATGKIVQMGNVKDYGTQPPSVLLGSLTVNGGISAVGSGSPFSIRATNAAGYSSALFLDSANAYKGEIGYGNSGTNAAYASRFYIATPSGTNLAFFPGDTLQGLWYSNSGLHVGASPSDPGAGNLSAASFIARGRSSAPSAVAGQIYFNSTDAHFYGYDGSAWKRLDN